MILLQVILILLNAIFACAEIAVISMSDRKLAKLAEEGDKRAMRLARLTSQPARFLATIQVAITLAGFLGSAFAADNFSDKLVNALVNAGVTIPVTTLDTIAVVLITLILSYFTLVFGELVPKRVGMHFAEKLALGMSAFISFIAKIFAPIVWLLTASTNGILRLLKIDPNAVDDEVSEEEIRMMVDAGSERGSIDNEEKEFIQNVFEFDDLIAGDIITHRTDIFFLWLDESMEDWQRTIHNSWHNLYPVCDDSPDKIIGILNAKDYFRLEDKSRSNVMKKAVRPAYFVPENVTADVLFKNMRYSQNNMAVVLDEYGGMDGIVTMTDLVERLVGDLGDDEPVDATKNLIKKISSDTWRVHGRASLEDLSEATGVFLNDRDYDTFNGLVFDALGTIPSDGEIMEIETSGLLIKIEEISNHKVEEATVTLITPEPNDDKDEESR